MRRITTGVLWASLSLIAGSSYAQTIAEQHLRITGTSLTLPVSHFEIPAQTPLSIQTAFGGRQNEAAQSLDGTLVLGDLTGPDFNGPISLTTRAGYAFQVPPLNKVGDYALSNIRLVRGAEVVQYAVPAIAIIKVIDPVQTKVTVRQLSPQELRDRGILIDSSNFEVFEYAVSFFLADGTEVVVPFPVAIDLRTREVVQLPRETTYTLPPVMATQPPRWTPPLVIPTQFEEVGQPEPNPQLPATPLLSRPTRSIPVAIVMPSSVAALHSFFTVALQVTNASDSATVSLADVRATIRLPGDLRVNSTKPAVAVGQPVPVLANGTQVNVLLTKQEGTAEWLLEGLEAGTHEITIDLSATYRVAGQPDISLQARPKATVVVQDPRFNVTFSHPDAVQPDADYSTFAYLTNLGMTTQLLRIASGLQPCSTANTSDVCRSNTPASTFDEISIEAGETKVVEFRMRSRIGGNVIASTADVDGASGATVGVMLRLGVSASGIPINPATLVLPYYAKFVDPLVLDANRRLLGEAYSLATAPVTSATSRFPRVIRNDVFTRAVDVARAGQKLFIAGDVPAVRATAAFELLLDQLGNSQALPEWDQLRRMLPAGRTAGAANFAHLSSLAFTTVDDAVAKFATSTVHRAPFLLAAISGGVSSTGTVAIAQGPQRVSVANEASGSIVRSLPYGDLSAVTIGGEVVEMAAVGRWSDGLRLEVTPASASAKLDLLFPDSAAGALRRATFAFGASDVGRTFTIELTRGASELVARGQISGEVRTQTTLVLPAPATLIAARQDLHLDATGHKVAVLFSRPVTVPPAGPQSSFTGKIVFSGSKPYQGTRSVFSGASQGDGSITTLTFNHALLKSDDISYSLTARGLVDPLNAATINGDAVPRIDLQQSGGMLLGTLLDARGAPLRDVAIEFTGAVTQFDSTDDDGRFFFESVPRNPVTARGTYTVRASHGGKSAVLNGVSSGNSSLQEVTLQFEGRGTVAGTVRTSSGSVLPGAEVVVASAIFGAPVSLRTASDGTFQASDFRLGRFTVVATDPAGRVAYASGVLRADGERAAVDITIYHDENQRFGAVRGRVLAVGSGTPLAGVQVGCYSGGYGVGTTHTDASGAFTFARVPAGLLTLQAADFAISRESAYTQHELAPDSILDATLHLPLFSTGSLARVEGTVTIDLNDGTTVPAAAATVQIDGMQPVIAGPNGGYVIDSVPSTSAGRRIRAFDAASGRTVTQSLPTPLVDTTLNLRILRSDDASGTGVLRVTLLDAAGRRVGGFRVAEPDPTRDLAFEAVGDGVYERRVEVGRPVLIIASANGQGPFGTQSVSGNGRIDFDGQVLGVTMRLPGQGKLDITALAATGNGGSTPLVGEVGTVRYQVWDASLGDYQTTTRTITTSSSGAALVSDVPAGRDVSVTIDVPGNGYEARQVRIGYDGQVVPVRFELNSLSTIRGTVFSIDGTTPVPNARVRAYDGQQLQTSVLTDGEGNFTVSNVASGATVRVAAEATIAGIFRVGTASVETPFRGGLVRDLGINLKRQSRIAGTVVNAANVGVAGAKFWAHELSYPGRRFGSPTEPLLADQNGAFVLSNVFAGAVRINAVHPTNPDLHGSSNIVIENEGVPAVTTISVGDTGVATLDVTVIDPVANAPVANAIVTLYRGSGPYDVGTTDGAGRVTFLQLPLGAYDVHAVSQQSRKSGRGAIVLAVDGGTEAVTVSMPFSGNVTGSVVDPMASGAGVPAIPVTLNAAGYETRVSSAINPAGAFTFEGVPAGTFSLEAREPQSQRRATATRQISAEQQNPPPVTLELERTFTLFAHVVDRDDSGNVTAAAGPVSELEVGQRCSFGWFGHSCQITRFVQGTSFQVAGLLENEPYHLWFRELGGAGRTASATGSHPLASQPSTAVRIGYPVFGPLNVTVLRATVPVAGARVTASAGGSTSVVYTDASGVARFARVALGAASVEAVYEQSASSRVSAFATAQVNSQSTPAAVTLTLSELGSAFGFVRTPAGLPSEGTRVVLSSGTTRQTFSDAAGRYSFEGLQPGSSGTVRAFAADGAPAGTGKSLPVIVAGQTAQIAVLSTDASAPELVSFYPSNGANGVDAGVQLRVVFNEAVTYSSGSIVLNGGGRSIFCSVATHSPDATTFVLTATPTERLASFTSYDVTITGVADQNGNPLAPSGFAFSTADVAPPRVLSVLPSAQSVLAAGTTFEVTFSEPVKQDEGSLVAFLRSITTGTTIALRPIFDVNGTLVYLSPVSPIDPTVEQTLTIEAAQDLQGLNLPAYSVNYSKRDSSAPILSLEFDPPLPAGQHLLVGSRYTVRATSADSDIARVEFTRTGGSQTFRVESDPFTFAFVPQNATSSFVVTAIAVDRSGNVSAPATTAAREVRPNSAPNSIVLTTAAAVRTPGALGVSVAFVEDDPKVDVVLTVSGTLHGGALFNVSYPVIGTTARPVVFSVPLPANLAGGSQLVVKATVTDGQGQSDSATTPVTVEVDAAAPVIISIAPVAGTRFNAGQSYQVVVVATDEHSGLNRVEVTVDGATFVLPAGAATGGAQGFTFTTPSITVPLKNWDTDVRVAVSVFDNQGRRNDGTVMLEYIGTNDPTAPRAEFLNPAPHAVLPAGMQLSLKLRARLFNQLEVPVVFLVGAQQFPAVREGTDYVAAVTFTTPAAGESLDFKIRFKGRIDGVDTDLELVQSASSVTVDSALIVTGIKPVDQTNVASYAGASLLVIGPDANLVLHEPLTVRNLLVVNGARITTIPSTTTKTERARINATDTLYLDYDSLIDVSERGYLGGWGLNADGSGTRNQSSTGLTVAGRSGAVTGTSGSHGGFGGSPTFVSSDAYGDFAAPVEAGAGGGGHATDMNRPGASGGGAIIINQQLPATNASRVVIAGTLRADGGSGNGRGGAGAGGSIYILGNEVFADHARMSAVGGDDESVAGGGGRIAVTGETRLELTDPLQIVSRGGRTVQPEGTSGALDGGAGTKFIKNPVDTHGALSVSAFDARHASSARLTHATPFFTSVTLDQLTAGPRSLLRFDDVLSVGGAIDAQARAAADVASSAVVLTRADQPVVSVAPSTTAPGPLPQASNLAVGLSASSAAGFGSARLNLGSLSSVPVPLSLGALATSQSLVLPLPFDATAGTSHELQAHLVDRAGRETASAAGVMYTVSANAPAELTSSSVLPLTPTFAGTEVTVTVSVRDDVRVNRISFRYAIGSASPEEIVADNVGAQTATRAFTFRIPLTASAGTPVATSVRTEDGFPGRTAEWIALPAMSVAADSVPPSVQIVSPVAGSQFDANAPVNVVVEASDAQTAIKKVSVRLGSGASVDLVKAPSGTWDGTVIASAGTSTALQSLIVDATDFGGNQSAATVNVSIVAAAGGVVASIPNTALGLDASFIVNGIDVSGGRGVIFSSASNESAGSPNAVVLNLADPLSPTVATTLTVGTTVTDAVAGREWIAVGSESTSTVWSGSSLEKQASFYGTSRLAVRKELVAAILPRPSWSNGGGSVGVVDMSTPAEPRPMAHVDLPFGYEYTDVAFIDDVSIAVTARGSESSPPRDLAIYRIDGGALIETSTLSIDGFEPGSLTVTGTTVVLAGANAAEVAVVDVTNPSAPVLASRSSVATPISSLQSHASDVTATSMGSGLITAAIAVDRLFGVAGSTAMGGPAFDAALSPLYAYVAHGNGVSVVSLRLAPFVDPSLIRLGRPTPRVAVTGSTGAVTGNGPFTVAITTSAGSQLGSATVAANGTFSVAIDATAGTDILLVATDRFGKSTVPTALGRVPYFDVALLPIDDSVAGIQNFHPKAITRAGSRLFVHSDSWTDSETADRILEFEIGADDVVQFKRLLVLPGGEDTLDVVANATRMFVATDYGSIFSVDLTGPGEFLPTPDQSMATALALNGNRLYAAIADNFDGTIRVYDSSGSALRSLGEVRWVENTYFSALVLWDQYLIALAPNDYFATISDLIVFDRSDDELRVVTKFVIDGVDAFRGTRAGNLLLITGIEGGSAVLDMTNPAQPIVVSITPVPYPATAVEALGPDVAMAVGKSVVTSRASSQAVTPLTLQPLPDDTRDLAMTPSALHVLTRRGISTLTGQTFAPALDAGMIRFSTSNGISTVTGEAGSATGAGPLVLTVSTSNGTNRQSTVGSNASFTIAIPTAAGDSLTFVATDVQGRKSTPHWLGVVRRTDGTDLTSAQPLLSSRILQKDGTRLLATERVVDYGVEGTGDLLVFDLIGGVPSAPRVTPSGNALNGALLADQGFAFAAGDDFSIVDLATGSPVSMEFGANFSAVAKVDSKVFLGSYNYLTVLDVTDRASPTLVSDTRVGSYLNFSALSPFAPDRFVASVRNIEGKAPNAAVVILTLGDENVFVPIPSCDEADDVFVFGTKAFVLCRTAPLMAVMDISVPTAPVVVASVTLPRPGRRIIGGDGYGWITFGGAHGIRRFSLTDSIPALTAERWLVGASLDDLVVSPTHLYALGENRLFTIDRASGTVISTAPSTGSAGAMKRSSDAAPRRVDQPILRRDPSDQLRKRKLPTRLKDVRDRLAIGVDGVRE